MTNPSAKMSFRYIGNKSRIVEWLVDSIRGRLTAGARIADPMCGTATVSAALADAGYLVTASDELTFPVLHAKARLFPTSRCDFLPFASDYNEAIRQLNAVQPEHGLFFREYSSEGVPQNGARPRAYFTGENAARIDGMRSLIQSWAAAGADAAAIDLLLNDLILAVNMYANIAGTYGYYRSSWNKKSIAPLVITGSPVVQIEKPHVVLQGKVEAIAPTLSVDACYLDPPYTKRQYGGNYHIPETIARQDEPTPAGAGGLRDWRPEYSNFCSRIHAGASLRSVLKQLDVEWVFLSYSEDGVIEEPNLLAILDEFGTVVREEVELPRFRSNAGGKSGCLEERLYSVRMR